MTESVYGVKTGQHIPGAALHRYLTDYAKTFDVYSKIQFGVKVTQLEPDTDMDGWKLSLQSAKTPEGISNITTRKVILATGLTSTPNMPSYVGAKDFNAPLFHAKDFYSQRATTETAKNVVVIGGAKSAYDVAYAFVEAGAEVDLVIRPNGNGPVWISHPWVMGGKKRLEKLLHIRWMTWMSPCPFGNEAGLGTWVRNFLHGTSVGRWIVDKFWAALAADVVELNGYNSHPEVKKLQPWNAAFWIGSGLSIHNYENNFFDLVKQGKIRVHIADIDHLSDHQAHLTDGHVLPADVLVCSTGWKKESSIKFVNMGKEGIGMPGALDEKKRMAADADEKILQMYPRLKDQPSLNFTPKTDPYRLYKFMVPPTWVRARNIAFAGMVSTVSTSICATVQALWISAFLDGRLDRFPGTDEEMFQEIMLHTQWGRWRYPTGYGATLPDFVFDAIPYNDLLLNDLGLTVKRKSSWFKELAEPYGPEDYAGLVTEWTGRQGDTKR